MVLIVWHFVASKWAHAFLLVDRTKNWIHSASHLMFRQGSGTKYITKGNNKHIIIITIRIVIRCCIPLHNYIHTYINTYMIQVSISALRVCLSVCLCQLVLLTYLLTYLLYNPRSADRKERD